MGYITKMKIASADEPFVDRILSTFDDEDFDYRIETQDERSVVVMYSKSVNLAHRRGTWLKEKLDENAEDPNHDISGLGDGVSHSYTGVEEFSGNLAELDL